MKLNFTLTSQIILLPSLASSGSSVFDGWYKDSGYLTPLTDYTATATGSDMTLYGKTEENINSYTITFDTRGGTPVNSITRQFGTIVTLDNTSSRNYCVFLGWETEYGDSVPNEFTIPAHNIILHASWLCTRITTPEELISFSNSVNDGTSYSGSTVFLDSDIDFSGWYSERFAPIGNYGDRPFLGVFNEQGHTISNLALKSSLYSSTGLFGISSGLTIQNVVIDGSCSFVGSYTSTSYYSFAGGIVGYCYSSSKSCTIENSVNMANLTFNGKSTESIFIGGIIGYLYSSTYQNAIKNCVNYGSVIHSGTSGSWVEMGGIAGISEGKSSLHNYIQNCLNYGALTYNGTSSDLAVGGIVGITFYTVSDNCVNSGEISTNKESTYIGSIVGYISNYTEINHCYWAKNIECNKSYGYNASEFLIANSSQVSMDKTTLNELNEYTAKNSTWSSWFMLHLNGGRIKNLAYDTLIVTQSHFPDPVREGNTFLFWCKDTDCTTQFNFSKDSINEITDLYAGWNISTATFDFGNGTTVNYTISFSEIIEYPENNVREGYTFDRWDNAPETMPASSLIATAQWIINNYTLTFIFDNGTEPEIRILNYSQKIEYPIDPEREGYTFNKWDNKPVMMPANDTTITAQWNHIKSSSGSNAGAIAGGVAGSIAVIVIIIVVLVLIILKKKSNTRCEWIEMMKNNPRIVGKSSNTTVNNDDISSNISGSIKKLYPENYKIPTIPEALRKAGIDEVKTKRAVEACKLVGGYAMSEGKLFGVFTKEDAEAVALYTFDFGQGNYEINPYRIINKALTSNDDRDLEKASGLLFLVMSALRKLPKCTKCTLYRGIQGDIDKFSCCKGNIITWHGLSSTSPDMNATKAFLANNSSSGKAEGTLFIIEDAWGYDIQPYSLFHDEAEVLLEPERLFRVKDVINADLAIINLQMLDTPLILPQVFGNGNQ